MNHRKISRIEFLHRMHVRKTVLSIAMTFLWLVVLVTPIAAKCSVHEENDRLVWITRFVFHDYSDYWPSEDYLKGNPIPVYGQTLHEYDVCTKTYRQFTVPEGTYIIDKDSACKDILLVQPTLNNTVNIVAWNDGNERILLNELILRDNEFVIAYKNDCIYTLNGITYDDGFDPDHEFISDLYHIRGYASISRYDEDLNRIDIISDVAYFDNENYYNTILDDGSILVDIVADGEFRYIRFDKVDTSFVQKVQSLDNVQDPWNHCAYKDGIIVIKNDGLSNIRFYSPRNDRYTPLYTSDGGVFELFYEFWKPQYYNMTMKPSANKNGSYIAFIVATDVAGDDVACYFKHYELHILSLKSGEHQKIYELGDVFTENEKKLCDALHGIPEPHPQIDHGQKDSYIEDFERYPEIASWY